MIRVASFVIEHLKAPLLSYNPLFTASTLHTLTIWVALRGSITTPSTSSSRLNTLRSPSSAMHCQVSSPPSVFSKILSRWVFTRSSTCNIPLSLNMLYAMLYKLTRHVFEKHGCPGINKVEIRQKSLSLSHTFWPRPTPRGIGCQWSMSNP